MRRGGELRFDGRDIGGLSTDRIARLGIAHVPQGRGTLARLSVRDNLLAGALLRRDRSGVGGGRGALPGAVPARCASA